MIPQLIDHLWQSTLFVAAAWLLTLGLRKNRAQVRYWVWFIASVKFLIPFSLFVWMGAQTPWQAASSVTQNEWMAVVDQISEPLSAPAVAVRTAVDAQAASKNYFGFAVLALWAGGFAAVAIHWLVRWRRMSLLRRSAEVLRIPVAEESSVQVMSSRTLLEPGVFGLFRPVLLLPDGIVQRLDSAQLAAILEHELCHVRRKDNLTAAVHMVVEAIFWFYPLVWWLGARLVDERERACDEEVLRRGGDPSVYAEGILNVCKFYVESPLACVSGVTGSNLKKRIEAIMKNRVTYNLNAAKKTGLAFAGIAAVALPIVVGVTNASTIRAQAPPAVRPQFEVATIKPCDPARRPGPGGRNEPGGGDPQGTFSFSCRPLMGIIEVAYVGEPGQPWYMAPVPMPNAPGWLTSENYQITAKLEGAPSPSEMRVMLQALLEDRFQMKIHREMRETPMYALTVASGGPKLQPFQEGSCYVLDVNNLPATRPDRVCGSARFGRNGPNRTYDKIRGNLSDLAIALRGVLDKPVVDRTGLAGTFDIHLEYAPDESTPGVNGPRRDGLPEDPGPVGPSIFTAVREQLGLRLESIKGSWEFLVIDSVERPSEN